MRPFRRPIDRRFKLGSLRIRISVAKVLPPLADASKNHFLGKCTLESITSLGTPRQEAE
jgi:hypothetical protein